MAEVTLEESSRKLKEMHEKGFAAMERGNNEYAMERFMNVLDLEPRLLKTRRFLRAAQVKEFKAKGRGEVAHIVSSITGIGGMISAKLALNKDPLKALNITEKLLCTDPLNKLFIQIHTDAALAAEMPEVAMLTLEVAREHYSKDIPLLKKLGHLYLDNNLTKQGREIFEILLSLKPDDQQFLKAFKDASALDTMNKGGWSGAGSYRDVMKDAGEATRLEQEGKAVKTSKDIDSLIADSLTKIEQEPQNVNYRRGLADLYVRAERMEEALKTLQETQELSGGADPQIDRMMSEVTLKQYDLEIKKLEEAGQTQEAEAKTRERNEFELSDAEERVKRYPNDLQFRYELGVLLYKNGRLNEAIQEFQKAQRNPQRRTHALYYMALSFKQKEQYDIALEQLEKAAAEMQVMDDTKKDVLYELGTTCELMGNKEQAAKYFKEIYSVDIGYRDVSEKIEKGYA